MGYRQLTERIDFPELSEEECYVVIRNPLLEPFDMESASIPRTPDGLPDEMELTKRGLVKIAARITDWVMWDRETGEQLALPSDDANALTRCPEFVLMRIGEVSQRLMNPTKPAQGEPTTSPDPTGRPRKNPTPVMS